MDPDRKYYANVFPAKNVYKFLMRHATRVLKYREIALRWNIDGKQTWQRFNSFSNSEKLAADVARRLPIGLYIGPAYNFDPTYRFVCGLDRLKPVEHKLIFDIDLTDYDDIRSCACKQKTYGLRCCSKCWTLAACAIIILRNLLRYKFGFHEFLFTFSGSKGAHCWVLDQEAQSWEDSSRLNLSAYFRPFVREFCQAAPMKCSVMRQCYDDVISVLFIKYIVGGVVDFRSAHGKGIVVACAKAHGLTDLYFLDRLPPIPNPISLWQHIELELLRRNAEPVVRSVVMMCTFPRLDKDITTSMQHLIRCPFSINGRHGKLCVPIRYNESLSFVPSTAPDANSIDAETMEYYLEIMDEAMVAPWTRLWVCRVCEFESDITKYKAVNIFLSESEWQEHHQEMAHGYMFDTSQSTAKALAIEQHDNPTPAEKRRVFLTLFNIKQRE